MNKKGIAQILGKRFYLTIEESTKVIETIIESMKDMLKTGENIEIRNFGSFKLTKREGRYAMDIRRGTKVFVEEHTGLIFIPGKKMKNYYKDEIASNSDK